MSDDDDNGGDFQDFKGSPDPSEGGITMNEIITSLGAVMIIGGFVLGLIRLMALNGGVSGSENYNSDLEQLYLTYVIMFVGMIITSFMGFGGMFKRAVSSFFSSE